MTYERSAYVNEIITRLKGRSLETLKGMVDPETTKRLLGYCLELMESQRLSKADKEVARRYIQNDRALLTEAEAARIEAMRRMHNGPPNKKKVR